MTKQDYFIAERPVPGHKETECGDAGIIKEFDGKIFMAIVDAAGHSKEAYKVVVKCRNFIERNCCEDLIKMMKGLHEELKTTRGAVVGLCLLVLKTGELKSVGMGNIVIRKFGSSSVRIIPRSGIVGYMMTTPKEETMRLYDGDVLVLYTDGVKEHFELDDYPEILKDDAKTIATYLIHQFGKEEDDTACVVLRVKGGGLKSQKND